MRRSELAVAQGRSSSSALFGIGGGGGLQTVMHTMGA